MAHCARARGARAVRLGAGGLARPRRAGGKLLLLGGRPARRRPGPPERGVAAHRARGARERLESGRAHGADGIRILLMHVCVCACFETAYARPRRAPDRGPAACSGCMARSSAGPLLGGPLAACAPRRHCPALRARAGTWAGVRLGGWCSQAGPRLHMGAEPGSTGRPSVDPGAVIANSRRDRRCLGRCRHKR